METHDIFAGSGNTFPSEGDVLLVDSPRDLNMQANIRVQRQISKALARQLSVAHTRNILGPAETFISLHTFRQLLEQRGSKISRAALYRWVGVPLELLPAAAHTILSQAPQIWYLVVDGRRGYRGQQFIIPLRYLDPSYRKLVSDHHIDRILAYRRDECEAYITTWLDQEPRGSIRNLHRKLNSLAITISRTTVRRLVNHLERRAVNA